MLLFSVKQVFFPQGPAGAVGAPAGTGPEDPGAAERAARY